MSASTHVSLEDTAPNQTLSDRAQQVAALTGLRGFAALMVVVVHVSVRTDYPWVGLTGYGPVSLFVLSGFLLYRPWARWTLRTSDRPDVRVFARRRVARIFPAYLVVLFVVALIYPVSRPDGVEGWLYAITLTWIYEPGQFPTALAQTWSLATELSWYVALPVMAGVTGWLARRRSQRAGFWLATSLIMLSLPVTVAWRWWVRENELGIHFTYSFWLPGFLVCFAGGALVALFAEGLRNGVVTMPRFRRLAADPWALLLLATAVALIATSTLGGPDGYVTRNFSQEQVRFAGATFVAITLLVVVVFGAMSSPFTRLLSTAWFNAIGRWSYGIYLWHLPLITILDDQLSFPDGVGSLFIRLAWVVGLSIPLGAATYAWIEKPAIEWSHQSTKGRTAASAHRNERGLRIADTTEPTPSATSASTTTAQPADAPSASRPTSTPGA
ncbi:MULTISPECIES: acyltransferase family protein [unclassified Nocardioides]|uniref:acyltransferase family protein n=1 Tax=unclassified Nocardioides TaxID=2615069 RepID=UPI0036113AEF